MPSQVGAHGFEYVRVHNTQDRFGKILDIIAPFVGAVPRHPVSPSFVRQNFCELWPAWMLVATAAVFDGYYTVSVPWRWRTRAVLRARFFAIMVGLPRELQEIVVRFWHREPASMRLTNKLTRYVLKLM